MNDDIIIIDNVIPKDYSDHIRTLLTGWDFGWVFNQNMVSPDAELQGESNHAGFNHFFFEKQQAVSQHFNFVIFYHSNGIIPMLPNGLSS